MGAAIMRYLRLALISLLLAPIPVSAQSFVKLWPGVNHGTIDSIGDYVQTPEVRGAGGVSISVYGTFTNLTLAISCTADGTNYQSVPVTLSNDIDGTASSTITATGIYNGSIGGCNKVKALATTIDSGEAQVVITSLQSGGPIGAVSFAGVTLNGGRIPVLADINNGSAVTDRNNAMVEGALVRNVDISSLFPVYIGGCASQAVQGAVTTDGFGACLWLDKNGAVHTLNTAGTATLANVNDAASSTALIAANTARVSAMCHNDSPAILYINYGATASVTAYTERVEPGGLWTMGDVSYTGAINGIWSTNESGAARCTELTR